MSRAFVMGNVSESDTWIVAGPHWSWGSGYREYHEADWALHSARFAYGYTRCSQCGRFVAGLFGPPHVCAGCRKKAEVTA